MAPHDPQYGISSKLSSILVTTYAGVLATWYVVTSFGVGEHDQHGVVVRFFFFQGPERPRSARGPRCVVRYGMRWGGGEVFQDRDYWLDYGQLELRQFWPGALVRYGGQFHEVSDPFRRPQDLLESIVTPVGSFQDKVRVGLFSLLTPLASLGEIFCRPETDTRSYLQSRRACRRP